jgi:hypothetical protein
MAASALKPSGEEPLSHTLSLNIQRRNLNGGQRAMIVAKSFICFK